MRKIILQSLLVIVGIVAGGATGGFLAFLEYSQKYTTVRYFAWAAIFGGVSENEYDNNSRDARQELLNTVDLFTKGVQSPHLDPTIKKALCMKRGLIEARLSIIENEDGNTDRATSYLSEAQEDLKAAGWADRSEATVLHVARRQPLPPCAVPQSPAKTVAPTTQNPCG